MARQGVGKRPLAVEDSAGLGRPIAAAGGGGADRADSGADSAGGDRSLLLPDDVLTHVLGLAGRE